jgi:uncharacterized membrane protein (DUF485 family)
MEKNHKGSRPDPAARPGELRAGDLTPVVGGWTDVVPLESHPAHERTADEEAGLDDWNRVACMPEFQEMLASKRRFVIPATLFFVVYYFALPVLVGYAPQFMSQKVWGPVNLAYLFALSQFFMAWILAFLYFRVAGRFDAMSVDVLAKLNSRNGGKKQ